MMTKTTKPTIKSALSSKQRANARKGLAKLLTSRRLSNGGWNEHDRWVLMICTRALRGEMLAWLKSENHYANFVKRAMKSREAA